jgi:trans-aconitate methyltransferase
MPRWNAADCHHHSTCQQIWARELIVRVRLTGQEQVLDIGSGDGKVTAEIAECVPQGGVVGIDSSTEMVRFAAPPRLHRSAELRAALPAAARAATSQARC